MGRPALTERALRPDNRTTPQRVDDMTLQQIEMLLTAEAPTIDTIESTLTEGYAEALALEAERWRLERRLGKVAREGGTDLVDEVSSIGARLNHTDGELERLRSMLGTLHERARSARKG
jgi:hypothetical protein